MGGQGGDRLAGQPGQMQIRRTVVIKLHGGMNAETMEQKWSDDGNVHMEVWFYFGLGYVQPMQDGSNIMGVLKPVVEVLFQGTGDVLANVKRNDGFW